MYKSSNNKKKQI